MSQVISAMSRTTYDDLPSLMAMMTGDEKHEDGASSTLDALWVLYDQVLRVSPANINDDSRDRFLLSKGHGPMAYYAILAAKGFIPVQWLPSFATLGSKLGHHPDHVLIPGVEISSGSLGHGLPLAVGLSMGLRLRGILDPRVVVMLGDAELDEGTNSEAIAFAGRMRLDQLTAVVIDNRSASLRWPGGIANRFAGEGWQSADVDGHSHEALFDALSDRDASMPNVVVAHIEDD
jgi:transketolase